MKLHGWILLVIVKKILKSKLELNTANNLLYYTNLKDFKNTNS